jgi:hypothetical protein
LKCGTLPNLNGNAAHEQTIINMLQKYVLEQYKQSPIPMDANPIVGPDPHRKSCETIQTQQRKFDPDSGEFKRLQTKFDHFQSDAQLLCDSDKQR